MERSEAVTLLKKLEGVDLVPLAEKYQVTLWKGEKKNKGWAGHVIERYLGLPINSAQSPNFGSWELKIVPLRRDRLGNWKVKETMAITMIDPYNVLQTPFEKSHLYSKIRKAIICAREFESIFEKRSCLVRVTAFDCIEERMLAQVREDYELVRRTLQTQGFAALTGKMGVLIQPRTKGAGHGSTSRAFYARTSFVAKILNLPC